MQIIFDLDGTILNSKEGILDSLEYSIKKHAPQYLYKLNEAMIGPPIKVLLKNFITNQNIIEAISLDFRHHYDRKGILKAKLFPGVYEVLKKLSKNNKLFISTNKPWVPTKKILNILKINGYFHEVLTIDSGNFKHKSEMVNQILSKNKTNKSIVTRDSSDDYESAKNNGVDFIYCSYGYGYVDYIDRSISTVDTLNALFRALNRL